MGEKDDVYHQSKGAQRGTEIVTGWQLELQPKYSQKNNYLVIHDHFERETSMQCFSKTTHI